jgi:hypothetical protein
MLHSLKRNSFSLVNGLSDLDFFRLKLLTDFGLNLGLGYYPFYSKITKIFLPLKNR